MVDVTVSARLNASPQAVASVLFDWRRDPEWIGGARKAEAIGAWPFGVGHRVRRTGAFLGRSFSWVTEVTEYRPGALVRMRHIAGPFRGGVDYAVEPTSDGSMVTIRNQGEANFTVPFMATMMRLSVTRDLRRLKALVEKSS
jgi:hypothetical protein